MLLGLGEGAGRWCKTNRLTLLWGRIWPPAAQARVSESRACASQGVQAFRESGPDTPTRPRSPCAMRRTARWVSGLPGSHIGDPRLGRRENRREPREGRKSARQRHTLPRASRAPRVAGFTCHWSSHPVQTSPLPPSAPAGGAGGPQPHPQPRARPAPPGSPPGPAHLLRARKSCSPPREPPDGALPTAARPRQSPARQPLPSCCLL